jgi:putative DNA methylase
MHPGIPAEAGRADSSLPDFALQDREFMELPESAGLYKGKALESAGEVRLRQSCQPAVARMEAAGVSLEADLAWHVRAWGRWVLKASAQRAGALLPDLRRLRAAGGGDRQGRNSARCSWCRSKEDGTPDIDALNAEFTPEYLADKRNPRWVAKPTVAYLWARTVTCKNCRATIPLLKTRWLCKKGPRSAWY